MAKFAFNDRSLKALATCDPRIVSVLNAALDVTEVEFAVVQGARTIEQQREYFLAGASKINPDAYASKADVYKVAKHITGPGMPHSRAVDIMIADPAKKYDLATVCYVAGAVMAMAKILEVDLRWGGNWNKDSVILTDQNLDDAVHFELV